MSHTISVATVYPKEILSPGNTVAVLANTYFLMSSCELDDIANGSLKRELLFSWQAIFLRCFIRTY